MRHAIRAACIVTLGSLVASCSFQPPHLIESHPSDWNFPPPKYEIFVVIHGDANYGYHDTDGNDYRADEEALAGALKVAQQNLQAEVFIFHEKHRRHFLFFFPRHDGEFYYYRHGQLLAQESYWRDHGQSRFDPELALYNRFRAKEPSQPMRLFLYFGHEIPEIGGVGYDASYRKRAFTVRDLANGLKQFTPDSTKFDFVVLSTCFNGSPRTVSELAPYAQHIMASPGNLHLSYFDLRPFAALDSSLSGGDVAAFAKKCARASFDRLTQDIQTEITVAVYDVDRVEEYVHSVDSVYALALSTSQAKAPALIEHCDCAEDSTYVRPGMSDGVDVLFRAARFGRSSRKESHSGWECPKRAIE